MFASVTVICGAIHDWTFVARFGIRHLWYDLILAIWGKFINCSLGYDEIFTIRDTFEYLLFVARRNMDDG